MGLAAAAEEVEHGGAGVDCEGLRWGWCARSWARKRPSPSPRSRACWRGGSSREEVGAGALQERAEGEVFGEAVDAGYGVEVGGWWLFVRQMQG